MIATALLSSLLLFQAPGPATARASESPTPRPATADQREEPPVVAKHSARIGGRQINYTTTTGFMPIRNSTSGDVEARIFYIAYTMDNPPAGRPLMFSFNGGPGSASVWLHMGALGPKRVKMLDDGLMPPAPYETVENEFSWLDQTDMVFIDPVGTAIRGQPSPNLRASFSR